MNELPKLSDKSYLSLIVASVKSNVLFRISQRKILTKLSATFSMLGMEKSMLDLALVFLSFLQ